jgi:hypothetical protein
MTDADLYRRSPNVLYVGDVLKRNDGFIGKVVCIHRNYSVLLDDGEGQTAWGFRENLATVKT